MKKAALKEEIGRLTSETYRLTAEVAHLKANWRPVPLTHEWQPRNPQCALCDDPRDSVRHQVGQVRVAWVPQLPEPS